jgi:hypothetical protein
MHAAWTRRAERMNKRPFVKCLSTVPDLSILLQ